MVGDPVRPLGDLLFFFCHDCVSAAGAEVGGLCACLPAVTDRALFVARSFIRRRLDTRLFTVYCSPSSERAAFLRQRHTHLRLEAGTVHVLKFLVIIFPPCTFLTPAGWKR